MKSTAPSNEAARLQALGQYNLLDTSKDEQFADLVRLASQICRTRVAFIGVVDKDRVWFKSKIGFAPNEIPRAGSFCDRAILQKRLFIVADTRADKRFKSSPLVIDKPRARFYAGMPLITAEGNVLGTLSVIDIIPRQLDQEQKDALVALARQVMSLFESQGVRPNLPNFLSELTEELHARTSAQEIQRKCEARLKAIVDYNITGISFANLEGNFTEANDAFFRMVGYTRDDLLSGRLSWRGIIPQEHRHLVGNAVEQMQTPGTCAPFETEYIRKDSTRVPVLFGAALLSGSEHEVICFSLDLSGYKQAQAKADHLAYHDALTNLPNQGLFKDRLGQALALVRRNEQMLAVMLVSLDRFKTINDTLGYVTADQLMRQVAQRLVSCVRESDTVARLGNDEFALLLTQVSRTEDAAKIAQTIKDALSVPFNFDNQEFFVTASIGISLCPDDGKESVTLLKSAATAMNRARERDGNDYQFYTSGRTSIALRQLVLENNLRPGLEREEFILHFQPQVDLKTFQVVGTEALVRWEHPGLGLLYPGEFIRLAEDSGLIVPIGDWVLRAACLQSKSWQDAGLDPVRMAVNLSARQFQQPKLVETIARILKDTALDPRYLELELTEGSVMKDPDEAIGKLHELKAMGLQISIDDFGTGYSSLNYLKRFPIDKLKVDRSFVSEIHTDSDDAAIVTAIITLAHALKLTVIAEGVETNEQLEFLSLLNCDEVQGFLFGKPLSAEEFTELLMERSGLNSRPSYDTNPLPPLQIILNELSDKRPSLRER
jgi:diguanylate cyclase (GGDEF)-like protein/PAS domain S-box-containing protein